MHEYRPNSHKSKEKRVEKKKVEKVVQGPVKVRKKSGVRRFTDVFISEDIADVKSYIIEDVLIPNAKKMILDIVDTILYPNGGGRKDRRSSGVSSFSYSKCYRDDDRRSHDSHRTRNGYSYDDIVIPSRGEAEEVLSRMDELIDMYGVVSVADLYDLVGKSCNYTDNKYGWTNVRNAEPVRVRDGYILKLPKALPID